MTVSDVGIIGLAALPALIALAYWPELAAAVRRIIRRDRDLYVRRTPGSPVEQYREKLRRENADALREWSNR